MPSDVFRLKSNDWARGLVVALLATMFTWLAQVFNAPGFDFASFNWSELVRIVVIAFVAYMGKNLASADNGKFLGSIG
jgi:hypothetical protein